MGQPAEIPSISLIEGSCFVVLARIVGVDGDPIQQADLSSIARTVYDVTDGAVVTGHNGVAETIANVIFDTLQTESDDSLWTVDNTGYNFKTTVANTAIEDGNNEYSIEFVFTDTASNIWVAAWNVPEALPIYSS